MPVDPLIGGAMIGVGSQLVGNIMGINNAHEMHSLQMQGQQYMSEFNRNQQMQLWRDTNYKAQAEEMRRAGINVGLMYGKGGGGGATAAANPGNVSAQSVNNTGGNALQGMGIMLQAKQTEAQIKLTEAQANLANTEAKKISGVDTENVGADTQVKLNTAEKLKLENAFTSGNMETALNTSKQILYNEKEKNKILVNEGKITEVEAQYAEKLKKLEIVTTGLNNELTKAKTDESKQITEASKQNVKQKWQEISQGWEKLKIEEQRNKIQEFKEETQAKYPGLWNVMGGWFDKFTLGIENITEEIQTEWGKKIDNAYKDKKNVK